MKKEMEDWEKEIYNYYGHTEKADAIIQYRKRNVEKKEIN